MMKALRDGGTRIAVALAAAGVLFLGAYLLALPDNPDARTGDGSPQSVAGESATVQRVVDGDTIIVHRNGTTGTDRVRLIGIDTPELGHGNGPDECYGNEARALLSSLLPEGTEVGLRPDPTQLQVDKYGRLLRHIQIPETNTNVVLEVLGAGAGLEYTYDKPYQGQADYRTVEAAARSQAAGYWGACR
ncbi:thermonuclease family protein [Leucobacter aridicollis]|uniref:Micrococcal nuclease n=1 Tax=Leucobacter aridicollis TaxID=283878 RepID=A0A852R507_9MICO|nr:thermonuclease family protein [Leucobacter aridicollis]MBL3681124.1 nuclease [Leucobacter aridicollis]NYD27867.1 micrococcal nuclease [Leucobacter aridicollis]